MGVKGEEVSLACKVFDITWKLLNIYNYDISYHYHHLLLCSSRHAQHREDRANARFDEIREKMEKAQIESIIRGEHELDRNLTWLPTVPMHQ